MVIIAKRMKRPDVLGGNWIYAELLGAPLVLTGARRLFAEYLEKRAMQRPAGPLLISNEYCPYDIAKSIRSAGIEGDISGVLYLGGNQQNLVQYLIIQHPEDFLSRIRTENIRDVTFYCFFGGMVIGEDGIIIECYNNLPMTDGLMIARKWRTPWITLLPRISGYLLKGFLNRRFLATSAGIAQAVIADPSLEKCQMTYAMRQYIRRHENQHRGSIYHRLSAEVFGRLPAET